MKPSLRSWAVGMTMAVGAGTASASDLWFHVQVHGDAGESRVTINLPLRMVQRAADFISDTTVEGSRIRVDDDHLTKSELRELWAELQAAPEMTFIEVEDPDKDVRVAKAGGELLVHALEDGEEVEVRIPAPVIEALLSGPGEELEVGAALEALVQHGRGELVTINGRDEQVRVWIDGTPEAARRP